jgi:hypothetical protein
VDVKKWSKLKPDTFFVKINIYNLYHGEKYPKNLVCFCHCQKLPNEKNRPTGENSPYLVTLFVTGQGDHIGRVIECLHSQVFADLLQKNGPL